MAVTLRKSSQLSDSLSGYLAAEPRAEAVMARTASWPGMVGSVLLYLDPYLKLNLRLVPGTGVHGGEGRVTGLLSLFLLPVRPH